MVPEMKKEDKNNATYEKTAMSKSQTHSLGLRRKFEQKMPPADRGVDNGLVKSREAGSRSGCTKKGEAAQGREKSHRRTVDG